MSRKTIIMIGMFIGSIAGQSLVVLLGADTFSITSILGSGAGGVIGVWLGYKFSS
jgi:membrane protein YqaA with SNARE-associated domain